MALQSPHAKDLSQRYTVEPVTHHVSLVFFHYCDLLHTPSDCNAISERDYVFECKRGVWMKRRLVRGVVAIVILVATMTFAVQAQAPTGTINGIVTDPHQAVVAGAHVSATERGTGATRETVSNGNGVYSIPNLPLGVYDVRITAEGFAVSELQGVQLQAGRASTLDAELKLAEIGQVVNVTDASSTIEQTQSMIQGQITSAAIENIPLNGRNFLELAYLVPGNRPAPNFDPTKTNTLEVSSDGSVGRGGNITVDGGENNDEVVGGTLSNFPQDSIQEFQIATAQFTAEAGRSGTSIINIVTKSGTNEYHGSLFDYERNGHLQALPYTFDRALTPPPFNREQFGGSVGGPFKKNKAWWFASAEYRDQNASIQTGTRQYGANPSEDVILNTFAAAPLREALVSSRVDYQINPSNTLMARYSFDRSTDTNQASAATVTPLLTETERQNSLNRFNSVVAGWTKTFSSTQVNNLIFHFDTFLNLIPEFPNSSPSTNPAGLAPTNELIYPEIADGVNFNVPQATHLTRYQFGDTFTWALGKHTLHFGGEYQYANAFGEINVFGSGSVMLTSNFGFADLNGDGVINDLDIPIAVSIQSAAPIQPVPIPNIINSYIALFAQDDWRVTRNLTLNLGLRWDYDTDATGTSPPYGPCPNLTSVPTVPCTWVAGVIDIAHHPDRKNFGPRVGFAYDPFGHGKTVIRGGFGIYYDRIVFEVPGYQRVQNDRALTINEYAGSTCSFPGNPAPPSLNTCFFGIPGTLFTTGSPTLAAPFSGQRQAGGVGIIVDDQNTHHPLFLQTSFGVQQALGSSWTVNADGLYVFGQRQLIAQFLRTTTSTSPYITCPGNNVPCIVTDPLTGISDQVTVATSNAHSWYDGLLISVQHRPVKAGPFTYFFNAAYTLSKTLDYSDDDQVPSYTTVENVNLIEGTVGPQTEKGYGASDETHRLTVYGQLLMPWGFSLSPLYTFGSGVPADTYLPDITLNGQSLPARLPILGRNSLGRSVKNSNQLNQAIDQWNALPACPAPAPCNAGGPLENVPANINFGSAFNSVDLRLMKDFAIRERYHIDLIAEAFNLFNSVNIRGFTNTSYSGRNISLVPVGTNPPSPSNPNGLNTTFFQAVSTAGGFFGSGGPRAFQFAVRFTF
jgi:Carboxypeptidase regulatory-like domain/TonB dependent receptor